MKDPRNVVIAILSVAVAVLGYLYYDSETRQGRLTIDVPGFKLEAK